jgi:hypothetical protein
MTKKVKTFKKNMKTLVPQCSDKTKNEIKRILNANTKTIDISESDIPFISSFVKCLLKEQGENVEEPIPANKQMTGNPDDFTPEKNKQDFQNSFSGETKPDQFETDGISPDVTQQNIDQIKTWAGKLDEFANFLNDPDKGTSLHRILADSDRPGSLLRGVTRKASDSITRIAGEVEKLKEVLNTFIITYKISL